MRKETALRAWWVMVLSSPAALSRLVLPVHATGRRNCQLCTCSRLIAANREKHPIAACLRADWLQPHSPMTPSRLFLLFTRYARSFGLAWLLICLWVGRTSSEWAEFLSRTVNTFSGDRFSLVRQTVSHNWVMFRTLSFRNFGVLRSTLFFRTNSYSDDLILFSGARRIA